ncbi:MAG TPA: FAD-dependent oxidoreductase [Acidimicrobiia bacterium]|nr:FAD-dependent oxidoreductase [Acidimicrobiia bacterium]
MIERTANVPATWDVETDVVVVGSGAAGLTAALTAADGGLAVTLLEADAKVGGTTAVSGGGVWIACNPHVDEVGVEDSPAEALAYLRRLARGAADEAILAALVERGPEMVAFVEDRCAFSFEPYPTVGPTLDYRPDLAGARHGGRPLDPGWFRLEDLGEWAGRLRRSTTASWTIKKADYYTKRMYLGRSQLPDIPLRRSDEGYIGGGAALVARLLRGCLDRTVGVATATRVADLVVDEGTVVGLWAESAAGRRSIRSRHGVVLATGGYEWNEELKRRFLRQPLTHPASPPTARGDGLVLGMAVGAALANLGDAWWTPTVETGDDFEGRPLSIMSRAERCLPHSLMVNRAGRRFVNEATNYYDICDEFARIDAATGDFSNVPAWLVFDDQFRERYPLLETASDGIASDGSVPYWLRRAGDLPGLAEAAGIEAKEFVATVERFNHFAAEGTDPDFCRGTSRWDREWGDPNHRPNPSLGPLVRPPFYAVRLEPGALGTKGGLRVDDAGRVLHATGSFIPGLYAAGNVAACSVPHGYCGPGATLGPAMTFGYIIGRSLLGDRA